MAPTRRAVLSLLPGLAFAGRKKSGKGIAAILELTAHRVTDPKAINVDGRVRNSGETTLEELELVLHFLGPDDDHVTQLRGKVEPEVLAPGEEAEFHWQMGDHPRAVSLRVAAADHTGFPVKVDNPGPYAIE